MDMKKFIFASILALIALVANAGNPIKVISGDKTILKNAIAISVVFDDSNPIIDRTDGKTAKEFYDGNKHAEYSEFANDINRAHESFIAFYNEKKNKKTLSTVTLDAGSPYTLKVKVDKMNIGNAGGIVWGMSAKAGGATLDGTMELVDNSNGETVCSFEFKGVKGMLSPAFLGRVVSVYRYLADGLIKLAK